jgi:hypothetical protein
MNKTEFFYLVAGFLAGFFIRHFFQDLVKESEPEETYPQSPIELESNPKDLVVSQETIPLPDIEISKIFRASRLGDPLTPDEVIFSTKGITFNVKSVWSGTESFVLYSDISGVEIYESVFFSTIIIKPKARSEIKIENFSKKDARMIKNFITDRLF